MARIEGEIVVARPVETVFDFVADERNEPLYNPQMLRAEMVSSGPIGAGTRYRAQMTSGQRNVEMTIEITAYDRPRRLASTTHMSSMDIRGEVTFVAVPGGTRMRWRWDLEPRGVLRLLGPLLARAGRRQEEATWTSLKRLLEQV